jgi:hypothetical protein
VSLDTEGPMAAAAGDDTVVDLTAPVVHL